MMGHKICFSEEIWIIIPKLSLLLLLIWSPALIVYKCGLWTVWFGDSIYSVYSAPDKQELQG